MGKILFPLDLRYGNKKKKEYLLHKFGKYVSVASAEILEVGVGNGRFGFILADSFRRYYGIEPDEEYLEIARSSIPPRARIEYLKGRAEEIPFNKQFDIVFYANSWHYIDDYNKALKETGRVLKPSGIVAILEPRSDSILWANPKLVEGHPEFDRRLLALKRNDLKYAERVILTQKEFRIVDQEDLPTQQVNFYILQK